MTPSISNWIHTARLLNYTILLVVRDVEDGEFFPAYFKSEAKADEYQNNIISESKLKIIDKVYIEYVIH